MYRCVITLDKVWKYVDVSVRVFISEVFIKLISYGEMGTFDYGAFDIGVLKDLELDAFTF